MIHYGWGDYDHTYMVVSFKRNWTSSEFSQMIDATFSDMRGKGETVNMIVDFRYSATPPMSIMSYIMKSIKERPNNLGRVIVVSNVMLWKRIYQSLVHRRASLTFDIHFVTSMDDAYQLLLGSSSSS